MPKYTVDSKMMERLKNDFTHHPPFGDQADRYSRIREFARSFAQFICENTPPSREQSVALTHLDIVVMEANAAIARNEKPTE